MQKSRVSDRLKFLSFLLANEDVRDKGLHRWSNQKRMD
jgi:hypothetical protein